MNQLVSWAKAHKPTAIFFLGVAAMCGVYAALGDVLFAAAWFAVTFAAWCVVYRIDRRLLCVLLCVSLMAVPRQAHAVQYALGGVVLLVTCGLGYVSCRAINCAKRVSRPANTNAEPEEFHVAGEECEYAAGFFWEGDCYVERRQTGPPVPVRFTLNILVESVSNITTTLSGDVGSEFTQSLGEFKEELNANGLSMPVAPVAFECFARNRHPVTAEQVPISFNHQTHVARIGKGGVVVRVESSTDLEHWRPLMALDVAVGQRLGVSDATESGACFYRVTTKEP